VQAALDAIDEALEQALVAPTERQQRWQLNQLRGLLLPFAPATSASKTACGACSGSCGPRWLIANRTVGCAVVGPAGLVRRRPTPM
jgi:hypothetical protein